ncbi:MAG: flavodoxin [Candidatus Thermochlorobacter sp.]
MGYIGLFYGTQTGNTELVAHKIQQELGADVVDLWNVKDATAEDMAQYSILILAAPTWYDGEMQADWEDFMPKLESIDFTDKYVGFVGLGDQVGYAQYFVDSIGVIADAVVSRGAQVFGLWSRAGYEFEHSKGLYDEQHFWGLVIDFENQSDLTDMRIKQWCAQIREELGIDAQT